MNKNIRILLFCVPLVLASCASKKNLVKSASVEEKNAVKSEKTASLISQNLAFVQKVSDTRVYADNIVADISFNIRLYGYNFLFQSLELRLDVWSSLQMKFLSLIAFIRNIFKQIIRNLISSRIMA